ncbi:hypothetical protein RM780_21680 [Streptomyces sp. DSM 44917]|uniref:Uncharacterized protein n=1 Tax=Streptomyces boetiae TaxID=3075541 RepID=A0ABU2LEE6_9ACTN|nr:hypothetical protein [Streptomyces sp. DSM 44917]MDT0309548.1 hypothetical protein [Streptomyces sp. DSM 44917]
MRLGPAATAIAVAADVAATVIGLWLVMYLLDANPANDLVNLLEHLARWLAAWSHDMFTFDEEWARVVCGYGLAALVYLVVGNMLARRVRRM